MTGLLSIGRSALRAYSAALDTVSQNIANVENADYVRRRTDLGDSTVTGYLNPLYTAESGLNGVRVNGIVRSGDEFLEASVRLSGASLVRTDTMTNWLGTIETGLSNSGDDVGTRLASFYSRADELAAAPFDPSLRTTFINEIGATADTFQRTAANLGQSIDQIGQRAGNELLGLNQVLENIAKINVELRKTPAGTQAAAGLLDQRDAALAVVSERIDVDISLGNDGVATIRYGGETIAGVDTFATLSMADNPDGSFRVLVDGQGGKVPANGLLAGLSRSRSAATSDLAQLDQMAEKFATQVNDWHAAGRTDAGNPGTPLVTGGGGAAGLTMIAIAASDLAVADASGKPNGNLLALAGLRTSGGVEKNWTQLVSTHANLLLATKNEGAAASAIDRNARNGRDAVSRVDLDHETADLVRLQQAYEAASRVIQVARELTQSILAIF
ncbi:flagellar hook-associated protein FlgK [Sphingorhabdus soli]|uniref:Flagellar hook-associated protein 1 n=1 Tax=Flavisphingopyxis soli TaxID=2601267 RepID=A0A5C6U8Q9_9SPHN|nr:flagellar hook-associated protein FlgK [Sphingorhabdus soli]TXC68780.1 flagellar hook-associated protein FlgK [Sphingorhabdus soli]